MKKSHLEEYAKCSIKINSNRARFRQGLQGTRETTSLVNTRGA